MSSAPDPGLPDGMLAERLLQVIDEGRRTATYKLAQVLALMDACAEGTESQGMAPAPQGAFVRHQTSDVSQRAPGRPVGAPEPSVLLLRQPNRGRFAGGSLHALVPLAEHAIENLVLADRCNNHKSDYLVALAHVDRWATRLILHSHDLVSLASQCDWESEPDRPLSYTRSSYAHLPIGTPLWVLGSTFIEDPLAMTTLRLESLGSK